MLKTRGDVHRIAQHRELHPLHVPHNATEDLAHMDPDPDPHRIRQFAGRVPSLNGPDQVVREGKRTGSIVAALVRNPEQDQGPVAKNLSTKPWWLRTLLKTRVLNAVKNSDKRSGSMPSARPVESRMSTKTMTAR